MAAGVRWPPPVPITVAGFNPDPKFSYVYSVAIDGIETALTPKETVASPGDALPYRLEVENFDPVSRSVEAWVELIPPDGETPEIILGPATLTLDRGAMRSRDATFAVPADARPGGPYTVRLSVGNFPDLEESGASFEFWVVE